MYIGICLSLKELPADICLIQIAFFLCLHFLEKTYWIELDIRKILHNCLEQHLQWKLNTAIITTFQFNILYLRICLLLKREENSRVFLLQAHVKYYEVANTLTRNGQWYHQNSVNVVLEH